MKKGVEAPLLLLLSIIFLIMFILGTPYIPVIVKFVNAVVGRMAPMQEKVLKSFLLSVKMNPNSTKKSAFYTSPTSFILFKYIEDPDTESDVCKEFWYNTLGSDYYFLYNKTVVCLFKNDNNFTSIKRVIGTIYGIDPNDIKDEDLVDYIGIYTYSNITDEELCDILNSTKAYFLEKYCSEVDLTGYKFYLSSASEDNLITFVYLPKSFLISYNTQTENGFRKVVINVIKR